MPAFDPIKCLHSIRSNARIRADQMHAFVPIKWAHSCRSNACALRKQGAVRRCAVHRAAFPCAAPRIIGNSHERGDESGIFRLQQELLHLGAQGFRIAVPAGKMPAQAVQINLPLKAEAGPAGADKQKIPGPIWN
jgi:hypothetical protein